MQIAGNAMAALRGDPDLWARVAAARTPDALVAAVAGDPRFAVTPAGRLVLATDAAAAAARPRQPRAAPPPPPPPAAEAVGLVTETVLHSRLWSSLVSVAASAGVRLDGHLWSDDYRGRLAAAAHAVTWGVKWAHGAYTDGGTRNVLFLENGLLGQRAGCWIDAGGYFADSDLCTGREYEQPVGAAEIAALYRHLERTFGWEQGARGDHAGPVLVALQSYRDAPTADAYYPLRNGAADQVRRTLELAAVHLPPGRDVIVRPHPRDLGKWTEAAPSYVDLLARPGWRVETDGDVYRLLRTCSCLVTVNSTLATEALGLLLPVAALGRGAFTGSAAVLDCSADPARLTSILDWQPEEWDVTRYLCAVLRHQLRYDAPPEAVQACGAVRAWLARAVPDRVAAPGSAAARAEADADRQTRYDLAAWTLRCHGGEAGVELADSVTAQLAVCPVCRRARLQQMIIDAAAVVQRDTGRLQPFTGQGLADLAAAGLVLHRPDLVGYRDRLAAAQATRGERWPGGPEAVLGLVYGAHLGDSICATTLPRKLAARSTRVWQARHRITYGVLDGNPHLSGFRNEGRLPMGRWQVGAGHHIQRFERWFGLPEDPYPRGEVYLSPAEQEWARAERARWPDGPAVLVAANAVTNDDGADTYAGRPWQAWADVLQRHGVTVVQARITKRETIAAEIHVGPWGEPQADRRLAGDRAMVYDDLPLRHYLALVSVCDAYLGTWAGGSHVAAAFGLPAIVVLLDRLPVESLEFPSRSPHMPIERFLYPQHWFATVPPENRVQPTPAPAEPAAPTVRVREPGRLAVVAVAYGAAPERIAAHRAALSRWHEQAEQAHVVLVELVEAGAAARYADLLPAGRSTHVVLHLGPEHRALAQKEPAQNAGAAAAPTDADVFLFTDADAWAPDRTWWTQVREAFADPAHTRRLVQPWWTCVDLAEPAYTAFAVSAGLGGVTGGDPRWQTRHPGYAWAISRQYLEALGGWNPWQIAGSGDQLLVDELAPDLCPAHDLLAWRWHRQALRPVPRPSAVAHLPVALVHQPHGPHVSRGYVEATAVVDWDGRPLHDIVCLDAQGLVRWIDPADRLVSLLADRAALAADPRGVARRAGLAVPDERRD